jgi:uncharacterized membrane protein
MPSIQRSLTIDVPADKVYDAFVDLSRWLEWNPHFRTVKPLSEGPLAVGSKARVALKLSPLASVWEVTELNPSRSFTWTSSSLPGLRLAFDHIAESADGGARATLRIDIEGPLSFLAGVTGAFYGRNLNHSLAALKRMLEGEATPAPVPQEPEAPEAEAEAEATLESRAEAEAEPDATAEAGPDADAEPKNE